jgi:hypothetical protein
MFYSQKKPYKSNNSKGKALEADRWDHGGFEQLQQEQTQTSFAEESGNKQKNSNKFTQDSTLASDSVELARSDNPTNGINKRWTHV